MFNRKALGPPSSRVGRVLATGLVVSALTPGVALAAPLANAAHGGPTYSPGYPSQVAPAQHDQRSPDAITGAPWVTGVELKRLRTSSLAGTTSGSDAEDGGLSTGAVLALIGGGLGLIALGGAGAITRYRVRLGRDRLAA